MLLVSHQYRYNSSIDLNCPKLNINVIFSIYTASKMFGTVSQYCAATSILDGIIEFVEGLVAILC